MKIRLRELRQLIREAWWEEVYGDGDERDLMIDEPSLLVPLDIKKKIKKYFRDMKLVKQKNRR